MENAVNATQHMRLSRIYLPKQSLDLFSLNSDHIHE
jgi:hypothetical protein